VAEHLARKNDASAISLLSRVSQGFIGLQKSMEKQGKSGRWTLKKLQVS